MNYGIIAAGEGSRLAQEGVELPKPLVCIEGRPMIKRLIDIMISCGAESISVIVNEFMTEVAQYLNQIKQALPVPLNLVVKTTPSSMHSFYELGNLMRGKGRFVLTTVDTIFREKDFAKYISAFTECRAEIDGMMAVTEYVDDEKPLYVATDDTMNITAFRDEPARDTHFVSGGIYGLDSKAIDVLDRCMADGVHRMRNFQRALIASGLKLKAYDMGKILDVDHAGDIPKAEAFLTNCLATKI